VSTNMHLKIDSIKGESRVEGHEDEIQIESFSFGMFQQSSVTHGHGSGAGRVDVRDMVLTKNICKADAALMQYCCSGKPIDTATLICQKAGGDSPVDYVKIVMTQVLVTSHSITGAESSDTVHVDLALNFASYVTTYTPQSAQGTGEGDTTQGWDIAANKAAA
jgi:type VI secretion system secreted protein Hcp